MLPISIDTHEMMFMRQTSAKELWISFVEKAFAKFYNSYKALEMGSIAEVVALLQGGIYSTISHNIPIEQIASDITQYL